jgi:hypothetical protein
MPQQNALTMPVFLACYAFEHPRHDNYDIPADLAAKPLSDLEPWFTDSNYTLDQIANRVGDEAVSVAKAKGYI